MVMSTRKIKVKRLQNSPYAIEEGETLGQGAFAVIRRAYNTENPKEQLAVKIISIRDEKIGKTVKSELQMLRELPNHPNLVNCIKIQMNSERNFYIIMEYCNQGNLEKFMFDHNNKLSEDKIWFFLKQFCDGYKVLYDRSIIHRDIKPENILIKDGNFKISDFGLSKVISNVEFNENMSSKGTPLYMAP
jgi:serine/threonine protein kinase